MQQVFNLIFIKPRNGYKSHRHVRENAAKRLGAETSSMLRDIEGKITNPNSKTCLSEALDYFEVLITNIVLKLKISILAE